MSDNTWPGGYRHAMHQDEHERWNAGRWPGTRQLCEACGEATGRCEDDSLYLEDDESIHGTVTAGPLCVDCWRSSDWYENQEEP